MTEEKKVQFISKYDGYKIRGFERFNGGVLKVSEEDAEVLRKTPGFNTEFWEDQSEPVKQQAAKQGTVTRKDIQEGDKPININRMSKPQLLAKAQELGITVNDEMTNKELVALIAPSLQ